MRNLLAIFAGLGLLLATFAGIALALVLGVVAAGTIAIARLSGRFQPAMAKASSTTRRPGTEAQYRVWNDGRGTIIDM
ncbi:hypothetical protein [Hoeflea ulvae]|uniref:Molecular chaperone DnaJ n=1 Tax=Hoeflea ulvae TaxID=2983764 RepID=A0ABT3YA69_9HYPH|nr:hypothetical protein [Hoeflea ulvae]MCY0092782.1 hypothetical protein [Hoeflea ulvae]